MSKNRFTFRNNAKVKGKLLIATELLAETPLAKTVVYVLQNDENGAFGVVLNRPADQTLRTAWQKASGISQDQGQHLLMGGPLGGPVIALHPFEKLGELKINGGIYLSATVEAIDRLIDIGDEPYRICLGVVGWKPGLLEVEVDDGKWYIMNAHREQVFDDSGVLWEKMLIAYGRKALCEILAVDKLPRNPERN